MCEGSRIGRARKRNTEMSRTKNILNRMVRLILLASVGFVALLSLAQTAAALTATAPPLGLAHQFGALGNSGVTGSAAPGTVINGDVGSGPTGIAITNFPPSSTVPPFIVHNTGVQPDGVVTQAQLDANTAYNALAVQGLGTPLGNNLSIVGVLTPGVYSTGAGDLAAGTTLTLNDPSPGKTGIFVFNVASSLTMNVLSNVVGTANPCNVYWRVGSSATLNGATFMGTVIADTSITVGGGNVSGRVLAGAVTGTGVVTISTGGNTIGGCSTLLTAPAAVPPPTGVALSKAFFPTTIISGGVSLLTITLSNNNVGPVALTSNLVDTLPIGMTTVGTATTTCGVGVPSVSANSVTLPTGSTIPGGAAPGGSCIVMVNVTAAGTGSFPNTVNGLTTTAPIPNNAAPAGATLTGALATAATGVPTLNEWGVIIFMLLAGLGSIYYLRRQRRA
jgi:hypothetical protein